MAAYEVELLIKVSSSTGSELVALQEKVKQLEASMERLGQRTEDVGSKAGQVTAHLSMWSMVLAGIIQQLIQASVHMGQGLVGHLAAGVKEGIQLNGEMEQLRIALGTSLMANEAVSSMPEGLKGADRLIAKMRKDAADLPGEFSDLVAIFRSGLIPALNAGMGAMKFENLAANIMAAAATAQIDMKMAGREAAHLIGGHAGSQNTLGQVLFGLTGDKASAFNKKSAVERLKFLEVGMAKYQESRGLFSTTLEANKTTLEDNFKSFKRIATGGVFDLLKRDLAQLNEWIEKNRTSVEMYAKWLGTHLVQAYEYLRDTVVKYGPSMFEWVDEMLEKLPKAVDALLDFGRTLKKIFNAFTEGGQNFHIKDLLEGFAVLKTAGMVASGAQAGMSLGGKLASMAGLTRAGATAAAATEGVAAETAIASLAGTIVGGSLSVIVAGVSAAAMGEVLALLNKDDPNHDRAVQAAEKLSSAVDELIGALKTNATDRLSRPGAAGTEGLAELLKWLSHNISPSPNDTEKAINKRFNSWSNPQTMLDNLAETINAPARWFQEKFKMNPLGKYEYRTPDWAGTAEKDIPKNLVSFHKAGSLWDEMAKFEQDLTEGRLTTVEAINQYANLWKYVASPEDMLRLGLARANEHQNEWERDHPWQPMMNKRIQGFAEPSVDKDDLKKKGKDKDKGGKGGTTIQHVEIHVASNQDPSRIARHVMAEMVGLAKNPKIAKGTTNWSSKP